MQTKKNPELRGCTSEQTQYIIFDCKFKSEMISDYMGRVALRDNYEQAEFIAELVANILIQKMAEAAQGVLDGDDD